MLNNAILNRSYLKSGSKFKNFMKFLFRKHGLYPTFTMRIPVKSVLKIYTEMPQKKPFSPTPPH